MYALFVEFIQDGETLATDTQGPFRSEFDLVMAKGKLWDAAEALGLTIRKKYNGFSAALPQGRVILDVYDGEYLEAQPEP